MAAWVNGIIEIDAGEDGEHVSLQKRDQQLERGQRDCQGQFANLIFGFAVTEALGIFSLLIALLLLFAL